MGRLQKSLYLAVNLLAEPRDLALADAAHSHRLIRSSTERVEMHDIAFWIAGVRALSAMLRRSRKFGKQEAFRNVGTRSCWSRSR